MASNKVIETEELVITLSGWQDVFTVLWNNNGTADKEKILSSLNYEKYKDLIVGTRRLVEWIKNLL